jgi:predicted ATP-grasp superfamily ATP-dependent carboligase
MNPILILGMYTPGAALARQFTRMGIPVFCADCSDSVHGMKNKYGVKLVCPDPQKDGKAWLEWLLQFGSTQSVKPVLIITSDRYVLPLNDFSDSIKNHFLFALPEGGLLRQLTSKRGTTAICSQNTFPIPNTIFPVSGAEIETFCDTVSFPIIAKPEYAKHWMEPEIAKFVQEKKVIHLHSKESAVEFYKKMNEFGISIIFQEIIPGPDENLYYHVSYTNREGKTTTSFIGRKLRITPIHFGSASYVESVVLPDLDKDICKFLEAIQYRGICGVEVKLDEITGTYKLVEINPRFGLWDEIGAYLGQDVALAAYNDLAEQKIQSNYPLYEKIYWGSLHRDIYALFDYAHAGLLTVGAFLQSYAKRPLIITDIHADDLSYSAYSLWTSAKGALRQFIELLHKPTQDVK